MDYLHACRDKLGGYLPTRRRSSDSVPVPALDSYAQFAIHGGGKEMSTTMAAVRILSALLRTNRWALELCPLSPMRRVPSEWRTCFDKSVFTRPSANSMRLRMRVPCSHTAKLGLANCWRRASARLGPYRLGPRLPRHTACILSRCCPSTFTTRCLAFNGWVTLFGQPPINGRGDS